MKKLERFTSINGKDVGLILIYNNYSSNKFSSDLNDFIQNPTKREGPGTSDYKAIYGKVKPYSVDLKPFSYDKFLEWAIELLSRYVFNILQDPQFLRSNKLYVQFKVLQIKGNEYYLAYDGDSSNLNNCMIEVNGMWLLKSVVAPAVYYGIGQLPDALEAITHELVHYKEDMRKFLLWDDKYEAMITKVGERKRCASLYGLYASLCNLREEGISEFQPQFGRYRFEFSMNGVREYNKNLRILSRLTKPKEAKSFYEIVVSFANQSPSGEFANGRLICLTIALSIAKMRKSKFKIVVGDTTYEGYDFERLDKILSTNETIYVYDLSKDVLHEAQSLIEGKHWFQFIKLYEEACDELKISDMNRIMTRKRFAKLSREALEFAEYEQEDLLKKKGYIVVKHRS